MARRRQTPIDASKLNTRSANALRRNGLATVEEVRAATDEELLAMPKLGASVLQDIRRALGGHDPSLRPKPKPPKYRGSPAGRAAPASERNSAASGDASSGGRSTRPARPLSPATVRRTHGVLHAALERAVRLDLIQANPAARVRLPTQAKQAPAVDTASVLRLLDASKRSPILHAFVICAAATGCRRGELAALRWGDVDLAAGRVRVARALSYLGAGGLVEKPPKSGKARTVALEPAAVEVLRTWRQTQRDVGAPIPLDGGWVFSHDGVEPWGPIAAETAWRRLCRTEGVHLRLHALRHWRASAGLEAGESVAEVAATLGHSSPHVTLSTYSHVLTSTGRSVLGDAMRGARTREG